jgi:hypothetical protein
MMAKIKALVDKYVERFMSRKLLVWVATTVLLVVDKLDGEQWVAIALIYIGTQGAADIATAWKSGQLLRKD